MVYATAWPGGLAGFWQLGLGRWLKRPPLASLGPIDRSSIGLALGGPRAWPSDQKSADETDQQANTSKIITLHPARFHSQIDGQQYWPTADLHNPKGAKSLH